MEAKKDDKKQNEPKQKNYKRYIIDLSGPIENKLLTLESASKFLQSHIKINNITGKLGESIKVNNNDKNNLVISVDSTLEFSKKYLKYLMKKFLKREGIGKFLTVSATSPNAYTVKIIKKNES